jgi:hypothetical protein
MDRCACGMLIGGPREYHPFAACEMFRAMRNGEAVFQNLAAVVEYGMKAQAAGVDLDQAMHDFALVHKTEDGNSAAG